MLSLGLSLTSPCVLRNAAWSPAAINPVVWLDPSDLSTLFQERTGASATTPSVVDGVVGTVRSKGTPVTYATASTDAKRPLLKSGSGKYFLRSDGVDDAMAINLASLASGYAIVGNRYGWMRTNQTIGNAAAWSVPLNDPTGVILRDTDFSAAELASLAGYFGTTQQYAVFVNYDTTINHRFDTTPATQITFIGANGVQYQTTNNNVATDVGAQGLTAPVTMLVPLSAYNSLTNLQIVHNYLSGVIPELPPSLVEIRVQDNNITGSLPTLPASLVTFFSNSNRLTGSIPALPASLVTMWVNDNQLTGSIPTLPSSLVTFLCDRNQLTGSIPALPASIVTFLCYSNQLTGSIPSLPASLATFYCHSNQLTGYSGTSVGASLGDVQCQNNLLTQAAVDAILVQLDAAGRTTGTRICNLGGTGNAAPSATGITAKNNLIAKGWTVTTN